MIEIVFIAINDYDSDGCDWHYFDKIQYLNCLILE